MRWRGPLIAVLGGAVGIGLVLSSGGAGPVKYDGGSLAGLARSLLPGLSQWQMVEHTDKMSGDKSQDAETSVSADDGEPFDLAASCRPGFVNFTVTATAKDAKLEVSQTQNGDDAFFLRTRLDNDDVSSAHSAVDYSNEASIFFYDPDIAQKSLANGVAGNFGGAPTDPSAGKDEQATGQAVAKFAGALTGLFAGPYLAAAAGGTIKDLEGAKILNIEVPMADRRKPLIKIALSDPTLRQMFTECQAATDAQYPHPKSPEPTPDNSAAVEPNAPADSASTVTANETAPTTTTPDPVGSADGNPSASNSR